MLSPNALRGGYAISFSPPLKKCSYYSSPTGLGTRGKRKVNQLVNNSHSVFPSYVKILLNVANFELKCLFWHQKMKSMYSFLIICIFMKLLVILHMKGFQKCFAPTLTYLLIQFATKILNIFVCMPSGA